MAAALPGALGFIPGPVTALDFMAELTKIDAARRQTNAAIRMFFEGEDPIAVHTVAAAGHRIVRDLARQNGSEILSSFEQTLLPGVKGKFWAAFNGSTNFLKHADLDAGAQQDNVVYEASNPILILVTICFFGELGLTHSTEMAALSVWCRLHYSQFFGPDLDQEKISEALTPMRGLSRKESKIFFRDLVRQQARVEW